MRTVLGAVAALLAIAYPVAVWLGLGRLGARGTGLLLLALLVPLAISRLRGVPRADVRKVLEVPAAIAVLLVIGAVLDDGRFVLAMPVAINLVLLVGFATSLRGPVSMVERYARMRHPDLSEAQVRYCRGVTVVWCAFFVVNGAIAAVLAVAAPVAWWALYTGLVSYALIGLVFAVEMLVRRWRFHAPAAR